MSEKGTRRATVAPTAGGFAVAKAQRAWGQP
jgi:hypothetical protein